MNRLFFILILAAAVLQGYAQDSFQLAPPVMQYKSVFFTDTATVAFSFAMQGTSIHYTVNGNEPAASGARYKTPVIVKKNFTTVKAKVFGNGFLPSETVTAVFIAGGIPVKQIRYTAPHQNYPGTGPGTLNDNKGGNPAFSSKNWLGFNSDTVNIDIEMQKKGPVKKILLHLLQDHGSWIFLPKRIEVYATDAITKTAVLIAEKEIQPGQDRGETACMPLLLRFNKKINTGHLQVKLFTVTELPAWHPGKGQKGWIFTDEIKIY